MSAFTFSFNCLHCGGDLGIVNQAQATPWTSVALMKCNDCRRHFTLMGQVVAEPQPRSVQQAEHRRRKVSA